MKKGKIETVVAGRPTRIPDFPTPIYFVNNGLSDQRIKSVNSIYTPRHSMSEDWSPIARKYDPLKSGSIDGTDSADIHDKAIARAVRARYKPNKGVVGNKHCTVFVARLAKNTSKETLDDEFSRFGSIKNITLVRDLVTGYSKGYAFVEYSSEEGANIAYRDGHTLIIDGKSILVDYEHERSLPGWVPRRLGGGFGGKKESGQLRFGGRDRPFKKPIVKMVDARKRSSFDDYKSRTKYSRR